MRILGFFKKCLSFSQFLRSTRADKDAIKLFLAAATSVLLLASSTFDVPSDNVLKVLGNLGDFFAEHPVGGKDLINKTQPLKNEAIPLIQDMLHNHDVDAGQNFAVDYMSTSFIIRLLCEALLALATTRRALRNPDCRSLPVTRTLRRILDISKNNDSEYVDDTQLAWEALNKFDKLIPHGGEIEAWRKQAKKDEDLDNVLEQGMQAQLLAERQEASLGRMHESEPLNALMELVVEAQISAEKREVRREEALDAELADVVLAQAIEAQVSAEEREARRGHIIPDVPLKEGMEALMESQREEGSLGQENSPVTPDPDHPRSRSPFERHEEPNNIARDALPVQTFLYDYLRMLSF